MAEVRNVVVNVDVDTSQLEKYNQLLVVAARTAGVNEDALRDLNDSLNKQASSVRNATVSQEKLSNAVKSTQTNITSLTGKAKGLQSAISKASNPAQIEKLKKEFNDVQKEIDQTTKELKELEAQAKRTGKTDATPEVNTSKINISGFGQGVRDEVQSSLGVLSTLPPAFLPITAGIAGIGLVAREAFQIANEEGKEFETVLASLSGITGAVGEDLEFLRNAALNFSTELETADGSIVTISTNAIEAGKNFQFLGSQAPSLLKNAEALVEVQRQAQILAASDIKLDTEGATSGLAAILNGFELINENDPSETIRNSQIVINQLAKGSQIGAEGITEISAGINETAGSALSLNVSVGETIAVLETLATNEALKGSRGGIATRNIFTILSTGPDETNPKIVGLQKALENLAPTLQDTEGFVKRFGRENSEAARLLINNRARVEEYTAALNQGGLNTALENAAKNANTLENAQNNLGNAITNVRAAIGSELTPALASLTQFAADLIGRSGELVDGFDNVAEGGRVVISIFETIGSAINSFVIQPIDTFLGQLNTMAANLGLVEERTESTRTEFDAIGASFSFLNTLVTNFLGLGFLNAIGDISLGFTKFKNSVNETITSVGGISNAIKQFSNTFLNTSFELDPIEIPEPESVNIEYDIQPLPPVITDTSGLDEVTKKAQEAGTSLNSLKDRLKELQTEFATTTDAARRTELSDEILTTQRQITQIESEIKPDERAEEKARKTAEAEAEKIKKEIERLDKITAKLQFETELEQVGRDSAEGLTILRDQEVTDLVQKFNIDTEITRDVIESGDKLRDFLGDTDLTEEQQTTLLDRILQINTKLQTTIDQNELDRSTEEIEKALQDQRDRLAGEIDTISRTFDARDAGITIELSADIDKLSAQLQAGEISAKEYNEEVARLDDLTATKREQNQLNFIRAVIAANEAAIVSNRSVIDSLQVAVDEGTATPAQTQELVSRQEQDTILNDSLIEQKQALADAEIEINQNKNDQLIQDDENSAQERVKIAQGITNAVSGLLGAISQLNQAELQNQLDAAGDNAAERERIEKEFAEKDRKIKKTQAIIAGALAIVQAFAQLGPIGGAIAAALIVATTAIQIAAIDKAAFKEGTPNLTPDQAKGKKPTKRQRRKLQVGKRGKVDNIPATTGAGTPILVDYGEAIVPAKTNEEFKEDLDAIIWNPMFRSGEVAAFAGIPEKHRKEILAYWSKGKIGYDSPMIKKESKISISPISEDMRPSLSPTTRSIRINKFPSIDQPFIEAPTDTIRKVEGFKNQNRIDYKKLGKAVAYEMQRSNWNDDSIPYQRLKEQASANRAIISQQAEIIKTLKERK